MLSNNMSRLIDLIELRIGTKPLNLPNDIAKDKWGEWISKFTLKTFSIYFPNKIPYTFDTSNMQIDREGFYIIDETIIPGNIELLGVQDIPWNDPTAFGMDNPGWYDVATSPFGFFNMNLNYSFDQIAAIQGAADRQSLFNNGIYIDFKSPNKLKLSSVTGEYLNKINIKYFKVNLLIKHDPNLGTIEPTKMEDFEQFAIADVATFLYEYLKYFDGVETVFANTNLRLDDIQAKAQKREEMIQVFKEAFVGADNYNQPIMYTMS